MFDDTLQELEQQIKSITYKDGSLIISYMNDTEQTIPYSEEKLSELRTEMFSLYTNNEKKYMSALETATLFAENSKVVSFLLLLGSFVFLYNLDITIEQKILSGVCFALATMIYHLYKDSLKDKYVKLNNKLQLISYYLKNIDSFKKDENYSINIEEVNREGMTLKRLKKYKTNNDML